MKKIYKKLITGFLAVVMLLTLTACGESWKRTQKNFDSNYNGGLDRTITVYDYTGNKIAEYSGKCDIEANENKVLFDIDDKRIIIYNAVVIAEEN